MKQYILSEIEAQAVLGSLNAAVYGDFFPDSDFSSIFSLSKREIQELINHWDELTFEDKNILSAINDSINNLYGYPHGKYEDVLKYTELSVSDLDKILDKILDYFGKMPVITDEELIFNTESFIKIISKSNKLKNSNYENGFCKYEIDETQKIEIYKDFIIYSNTDFCQKLEFKNMSRVNGSSVSDTEGQLEFILRNNDKFIIEFNTNKYHVEEAELLLYFLNRNTFDSKYHTLKYFRRLWIE